MEKTVNDPARKQPDEPRTWDSPQTISSEKAGGMCSHGWGRSIASTARPGRCFLGFQHDVTGGPRFKGRERRCQWEGGKSHGTVEA